MDGIFVRPEPDSEWQRPRSKKQIREIAAEDLTRVEVEYTSVYHHGPSPITLDKLERGTKLHFVGPNPHTMRKFYGIIEVTETGVRIR